MGRPPQASLQLFFMASYDIDRFRRAYVLPEGFYAQVEADDEPLLGFAYRFLRQVLFGERTVEEIAGAWEQRMETRKEVWDARRQGEIERRMAEEDQEYGDGCDTYCIDN